jgi:hypothetical protein
MPNTTIVINPNLLLISSPLKEAQLITELKELYNDNWVSVYKEIKSKERLESSFNNKVKTVCNGNCKDKSNNTTKNVKGCKL